MIPRYQRIVFWTLTGGILLMALLLLRGCVRTQQHIAEMRDQSPIPAPIDSPAETVTIAQANDADGSINDDQITLSLPKEPPVRARVLLARVLSDAAQPASPPPPARRPCRRRCLLRQSADRPARRAEPGQPVRPIVLRSIAQRA